MAVKTVTTWKCKKCRKEISEEKAFCKDCAKTEKRKYNLLTAGGFLLTGILVSAIVNIRPQGFYTDSDALLAGAASGVLTLAAFIPFGFALRASIRAFKPGPAKITALAEEEGLPSLIGELSAEPGGAEAKEATFRSKPDTLIECPVCHKTQMPNRGSCYACGCKFTFRDE